MGDQHRFGPLQMGVGGHNRLACLLGSLDQLPGPTSKMSQQIADPVPHVQPEVGCDLLIAAAASVQLQAEVAQQLHQLQFHEVVNVFRILVSRRIAGQATHKFS